jgi:hypothetical protein
MFKLGTNTAISSRGDSSTKKLVKKICEFRNAIFWQLYMTLDRHIIFSEKTANLSCSQTLILNNAYNGKTRQLTRRYFLGRRLKDKNC